MISTGGAAAEDIRNGAPHADRRWAGYLQQCSLTNTPRFHPYFDGSLNPPTYAGPSGHHGNQRHRSPTNNYPVIPLASSRMFRVIPWTIMLILALLLLPIEPSAVFHSRSPVVDGDREQSLTPTPSNVGKALNKRMAHSPAHSTRVGSPATKRTPSNVSGASATTDDATLWEQTRAAAMQWTALGTVEPNDQNGQSVLMEWVERRPDAFYCKVPTPKGRCRTYNAKKDRILSHVRKDHLNFRPFRCRGVCGTPHW